jgi:hypothetical protein
MVRRISHADCRTARHCRRLAGAGRDLLPDVRDDLRVARSLSDHRSGAYPGRPGLGELLEGIRQLHLPDTQRQSRGRAVERCLSRGAGVHPGESTLREDGDYQRLPAQVDRATNHRRIDSFVECGAALDPSTAITQSGWKTRKRVGGVLDQVRRYPLRALTELRKLRNLEDYQGLQPATLGKLRRKLRFLS